MEILERESRGDPKARLAVGVYLHRLQAGVAAMTAAMGGLDVLAFTGGVGERAVSIRARATARLDFLGVAIDHTINDQVTGDTDIGDTENISSECAGKNFCDRGT